MTKKILSLSAILMALTIGGITMASQPAKPIKQATQSTNVATPAASFDAINGLPKDTPVTEVPAPDPGTSETSTGLPAPDNPSVDSVTPTPVTPIVQTETQPTQTTHSGPTNEQSNTAINDPTLNRIQITNP